MTENFKRISSKDNPLIKHISKLNSSSSYRRKNSQFVCEGVRLCEDAYNSGCEINSLVVSASALEKYAEVIEKISRKACSGYVFTDELFKKITDTKTPQGLLCVIKALDNPTLFDKIKCNGKFLALESIQDPVNLGTILRTAEAVGIDGIVLSDDCCDIYSPKVVRGSMGAVFRIPYTIVGSIAEFIGKNKNLRSYAAVVDKDAEKITKTDFSLTPCIVAVGNEGNGLRKQTADACDKSITIPMKGRAESLNAAVAAGIIMWEMLK